MQDVVLRVVVVGGGLRRGEEAGVREPRLDRVVRGGVQARRVEPTDTQPAAQEQAAGGPIGEKRRARRRRHARVRGDRAEVAEGQIESALRVDAGRARERVAEPVGVGAGEAVEVHDRQHPR